MESGQQADLIICSEKKAGENRGKKEKSRETSVKSTTNKGKSKDLLNSWRKSKELQKERSAGTLEKAGAGARSYTQSNRAIRLQSNG